MTTTFAENWDRLEEMAVPFGPTVELLGLLDNCKWSVGHKRQALLDMATGKYVVYVDDDDEVLDGYVEQIMRVAIDSAPHVIVYPTLASFDGAVQKKIEHGLGFENEEITFAAGGRNPTRTPWHIHPWRRDIVKQYRFSDTNYGEDWDWLRQFVNTPGLTEHRLNVPLYHYRFSTTGTEASRA